MPEAATNGADAAAWWTGAPDPDLHPDGLPVELAGADLLSEGGLLWSPPAYDPGGDDAVDVRPGSARAARPEARQAAGVRGDVGGRVRRAQPVAVEPVAVARPVGEGVRGTPSTDLPVPTATTLVGVLRSGRANPGRRGAIALALLGVVAAAVAGGVLVRARPSEQLLTAPPVIGSEAAAAGPQVVVDVAGRVRKPGLVRLSVGSRVDDALKAAGGALPGASTASLNLARKLADGEQVLVAAVPLPGAAGVAGGAAALSGGLLDLNLAAISDLDGLPGIGPVLAERIVSWRTEHGGRFASVDQLREVSGIGESKYQTLKSKVRV